MKKCNLFLLIFVFSPLFFVFAQEELPLEFKTIDEETEEQITKIVDKTISEYPTDAVFVINSFNFNITGITKRFALINKAELEEGEEITGFYNLERYIQEKQQILYNERSLESVDIDYFIREKSKDGKYPVDLEITTKDSWNIIAIPKPQYSTNSGFKLTVNYRDYNFLGTLVPLRFDIGYRFSEKNRNYFSFMLDTNTPFVFFKLNWNFIFYNGIDYSPDLEKSFIYKNVTGFQVQLPFFKTVFVLGFKESLFVNQEHDETYKPLYGDNQNGLYFSSNPYIQWFIPTGIEVKDFGQIYYSPNFSANINHELPPWPLDDIKKETSLNYGHSLSFGRTDWIENLRNGLSFNISNSINYSFRNKRYEVRPIDIYYHLNITNHLILLKDRLGVSTRFFFRHWLFNAIYENAGDVLRGIPDDNIQANLTFSINLDFPVKVLEARPDQWFGVSKFRFFNFDMYLGPFFDVAIFHHPVAHQTAIGFRNILFTGGMEAVFFPLRMRSFHLRASLGLNLLKLSPFGKETSPYLIPGGYDPSSAGKYEIYIGTDFHF